MATRYCEVCRQEVGYGEHSEWCSRRDPGERPPEAIIWERLDELEGKINRLAAHTGLPVDWDDE